MLLRGAGVPAGTAGSAGGITSLISCPTLPAAVVPALSAKVANAVRLVASWPGSASGSRPALRDRSSFLRRWVLIAAAGGPAGVALLLCTPAGVFGPVVPFLLVSAFLALLLQPRVSAWHENGLIPANRFLPPCGLLALPVHAYQEIPHSALNPSASGRCFTAWAVGKGNALNHEAPWQRHRS